MAEHKRVLVVADTGPNRAWLGRELDAALRGTCNVIGARDPTSALSLLETDPFDAIVCDLAGPASESIGFLNSVSSRFPDVGGIVIVDQADYKAVECPLHSSRFTVLFRPLDAERLRCWVENAIMLTKVKRDTDRLKARALRHLETS